MEVTEELSDINGVKEETMGEIAKIPTLLA